MSNFTTTLLFHGNCIDGWFSAYFAYSSLQQHGEIQMFPIAPSQPNTWPRAETMADTHIWLLDVSVPQHARDKWMMAGAKSIQCIDHHATAKEHWAADNNPIHTECCAALQTYRYFYPDHEVPEWLHSVDRVDRWENVTYEDRCLREYLHEIARKPVQHLLYQAFEMSNQFVYCMEHHPESFSLYCQHGEKILIEKDAQLMSIIDTKGRIVQVDADYTTKWNLPPTWQGLNLFIMDTTDIALDTTEASHLVFTKHPDVDVFINYRNKTFYSKHDSIQIMKSMVVYSARTRSIDVTVGTIFRGHPTSAGASLVRGEAPHFPFLL